MAVKQRMGVVLRDYQEDMISRARASLATHRRVLIQAPTGAGKTALATFMADRSVARNRLVDFICHRAELVEGTSKTFHKFGLAHGYIAAGYPMNRNALANVCSIDTLKGRLAAVKAPRLALWDECHHLGAAGWQAVMNAWPDTQHVGLSATPWRLDGTGLDAFFEDMVEGPAVSWLIERGHLSPYRVYAPHVPDMKGVRKQMGDFAKADSAERMDKPKITGDAIKHWQRYANGLKTIVFSVNVKHSQHVVEQFLAAGVKAAHLDGGTPKGERERIIRQFAAGEITVLSNVGLFGEGFDLSAIAQMDVTVDCVIDLNPSQSLSAVMQRWGRALRPGPGKVAIILDHAGNTSRHGFPDDEREWTLEGREKGRKASKQEGPLPPITCDHCFMQIKRPLPERCPGPDCGKLLLSTAQLPKSDDEAVLIEVTEAEKKIRRAKLKQEESEAKDLHALVALGVQRNYKNPVTWATKKFQNSGWRKALSPPQPESNNSTI